MIFWIIVAVVVSFIFGFAIATIFAINKDEELDDVEEKRKDRFSEKDSNEY